MNKWITRIVLALAAHGILLLVAAILFAKFELSFVGWFIGTILFSIFTVALRGMMTKLAAKYASGATFLGGLVLTWVGLLLTDLMLSQGKFYLEGVGTWIFVTLIVWVGTVVYDQVDDKLIDRVSNRAA